jgi:hypothetical protein
MRGIGYPREQAWAALNADERSVPSVGALLFLDVPGMRWRYGPEHASKKCEF